MAKKNFEDTLVTVGILSASIGALSEAFGENEDVQEALVKTQQALVLSQTLANVVKEKGAIIDTVQLVKDKALVASKILLTNTMRIFGVTSAQARWKYSSGNPCRRKHSFGVSFLILQLSIIPLLATTIGTYPPPVPMLVCIVTGKQTALS